MTDKMSTKDLVEAAGFYMRRSSTWIYNVYSPSGEKLYSGTMTGIKSWLRQKERPR